jgi:DNA-binding GntR family transcriptional regulator
MLTTETVALHGEKRLRPPPTRSLVCAEEIRKRILDGRYPGGMRLQQEALAEELGVSRIPVREALVLLESEGLLKIFPHRGAVVLEVSADEVAESFEMRSLIEPRLLEKSAPHLTSDDFSVLRNILEEYSENLRSLNIARWGELNIALHTVLYKHANSPRMEATVQQLLIGSDRFTRMHLVYAEARVRAEQEHQMIVDLCQIGHFSTAADLLRKHIQNAGVQLVASILKPATE